MRVIVKQVSVNDGNPREVSNGDRLYVVSEPRSSAFVRVFLEHGYRLADRSFLVNPAIQGGGNYSFYLGGWNYLFVKEIGDGEEDDSDRVLEEAVAEALAAGEALEDFGCSPEDYDEMESDGLDEDYDPSGEY